MFNSGQEPIYVRNHSRPSPNRRVSESPIDATEHIISKSHWASICNSQLCLCAAAESQYVVSDIDVDL